MPLLLKTSLSNLKILSKLYIDKHTHMQYISHVGWAVDDMGGLLGQVCFFNSKAIIITLKNRF